MSVFHEQTHYEVLEVPEDATGQQIERAYRIARQTYQPGSMSAYSVFSDDEAADILRQVEEAFAVLSDARLRREYDARLVREAKKRAEASAAADPPPAPTEPKPEKPREPESKREELKAFAATMTPRWREDAIDEATVDLDEPLEPADGIYDGAVLRRIRLSRGIELDEISAITKVNERYLERIEGNRYESLPPLVYLRGFLREYAKCLNLDAKHVSDSYLARKHEREQLRGAR